MKILAVNAGSSSVKFKLYELPENKELISGAFEKIGIGNSFYTIKHNGDKIKREFDLPNHSVAVKMLLEELINNKVISSLDDLDGIGQRVVNAGPRYSEPILVGEKFLTDMKTIIEFSPAHNKALISVIKSFNEIAPQIPMVCVFDTHFHSTIEKENYLYAVPYEWYEKYNIKKYGFHGTSHKYVNNKICEELNNPDLKVINCHLGNGSSITAIEAGKVINTSMGFTPLAGLIMGTRCGDVDLSFIPHVMKKEGLTFNQVVDILYNKSGLLAISGCSSDLRDIEAEMQKGNERCKLAVEMLSRGIANYIAMYNNMINGADVLTFSGGIGENSSIVRNRVVELVASLGIKIDTEKNKIGGDFKLISSQDSKIPVYIVPTNEELVIAQETYELIK